MSWGWCEGSVQGLGQCNRVDSDETWPRNVVWQRRVLRCCGSAAAFVRARVWKGGGVLLSVFELGRRAGRLA